MVFQNNFEKNLRQIRKNKAIIVKKRPDMFREYKEFIHFLLQSVQRIREIRWCEVAKYICPSCFGFSTMYIVAHCFLQYNRTTMT